MAKRSKPQTNESSSSSPNPTENDSKIDLIKYDCLPLAIESLTPETIVQLIAKGIDLNYYPAEERELGVRPIHALLYRALCNDDCNPWDSDEHPKDPMEHEYYNKVQQMMDLLLDNGCDPSLSVEFRRLKLPDNHTGEKDRYSKLHGGTEVSPIDYANMLKLRLSFLF